MSKTWSERRRCRLTHEVSDTRPWSALQMRCRVRRQNKVSIYGAQTSP
jgi:hypothetical protein